MENKITSVNKIIYRAECGGVAKHFHTKANAAKWIAIQHLKSIIRKYHENWGEWEEHHLEGGEDVIVYVSIWSDYSSLKKKYFDLLKKYGWNYSIADGLLRDYLDGDYV